MASIFREQVYEIVRLVPKGQVVTYGQIARKIKKEKLKRKITNKNLKNSARVVGNALHHNIDLAIPCHRVVDRNGRIAPHYGLGGSAEQRRRLLAEGVKFKDKMHVDLDYCLWQR